jgi:hypothetical protein
MRSDIKYLLEGAKRAAPTTDAGILETIIATAFEMGNDAPRKELSPADHTRLSSDVTEALQEFYNDIFFISEEMDATMGLEPINGNIQIHRYPLWFQKAWQLKNDAMALHDEIVNNSRDSKTNKIFRA